MADPYLTVDALRAELAALGGPGARTAGTLADERLEEHADSAEAEVIGKLRGAYVLPEPQTPEVPPLLVAVIAGIAGYSATLEFKGSDPIEDRDPIVLRYQLARERLRAIVDGTLNIGLVPAPGETVSGEAVAYDGTPDVNLAGGWLADSQRAGYGYGYGGAGW